MERASPCFPTLGFECSVSHPETFSEKMNYLTFHVRLSVRIVDAERGIIMYFEIEVWYTPNKH